MKRYWWLLALIIPVLGMVGLKIAYQPTPEERAASEFRSLTILVEIVDGWNLESGGNPESLMTDFRYLHGRMVSSKVVDEAGWNARYQRLAEGKLAYCLQALAGVNRNVFAARPDAVAGAIKVVRDSGGDIAKAVALAKLTPEQASACSAKSWSYIKEPGYNKDEFEFLIQAIQALEKTPTTRT